jgi:subtilisin family serine protease
VRSLRLVLSAALIATSSAAMTMPARAASRLAIPSPSSAEWWLSSWGIDKIWPITQGKGVTVAVLDTGVNAKLPGLAGAVVSGGDVTGAGTDGRTDTDTRSGGHGTAMTQLIVGNGRGTGLVGVAPQAHVLPVTVGNGAATARDFHVRIAKGIQYAVDHGAKVISISQAFPADAYPDLCPTDILASVQYAARHDVVITAATGDNGGVGNSAQAPASCPGVLAVGAVDAAVKPWALTQQVWFTGVAGPGAGIGWIGKDGKYHARSSGTSQATALTAGGLALVRAANPDMSAREIVQRSLATALDSGTPGPDNQTGYGAFRIHRVMDLSFKVSSTAPNPSYARLDKAGGKSTPAPSSSTGKPAAVKDKSGGTPTLLLIAIGVGVLLVVLVIALVIARRRPVRPEADGTPAESGASTPQSFGRADPRDPR